MHQFLYDVTGLTSRAYSKKPISRHLASPPTPAPLNLLGGSRLLQPSSLLPGLQLLYELVPQRFHPLIVFDSQSSIFAIGAELFPFPLSSYIVFHVDSYGQASASHGHQANASHENHSLSRPIIQNQSPPWSSKPLLHTSCINPC